jgi:hypothetical protein
VGAKAKAIPPIIAQKDTIHWGEFKFPNKKSESNIKKIIKVSSVAPSDANNDALQLALNPKEPRGKKDSHLPNMAAKA